jgi:hypothetical protein
MTSFSDQLPPNVNGLVTHTCTVARCTVPGCTMPHWEQSTSFNYELIAHSVESSGVCMILVTLLGKLCDL